MNLTENEIFEGEEKIAYLDAEGRPRMTPGHGDKRESVIAFLDKREAKLAEETEPVTEYEVEKEVETIAAERATPTRDHVIALLKQDISARVTTQKSIATPNAREIAALGKRSSAPECPITGNPSQGEKDPAVIDWWFKNHPAIAKEKYARIRLNR